MSIQTSQFVFLFTLLLVGRYAHQKVCLSQNATSNPNLSEGQKNILVSKVHPTILNLINRYIQTTIFISLNTQKIPLTRKEQKNQRITPCFPPPSKIRLDIQFSRKTREKTINKCTLLQKKHINKLPNQGSFNTNFWRHDFNSSKYYNLTKTKVYMLLMLQIQVFRKTIKKKEGKICNQVRKITYRTISLIHTQNTRVNCTRFRIKRKKTKLIGEQVQQFYHQKYKMRAMCICILTQSFLKYNINHQYEQYGMKVQNKCRQLQLYEGINKNRQLQYGSYYLGGQNSELNSQKYICSHFEFRIVQLLSVKS
eukprot:TRINITY_DN2344_c0_g1_i8.p2 TRINITY_DN2344_c0_g1~~TRINITY_DN2344_c0_g1_i8.p2  ORF type:complete len:310 (+),score=-20.28 TRINITY_DN2344_c0_g1_i8:776-1705(+)